MTETLRSHRYNPCKGCPDRYYACSDHCRKESFLVWKEEQEKIRKARKTYYQPAWATAETDPANYRKRKKAK